MTEMMFPLDFDPTDGETLRTQVENMRRVQQIQQKGDRLMEAMGELYDLRAARDWKGGATNDEKGLVGEIEGLRTDLHRLNGQVAEVEAEAEAANHAQAHAENERRMAEAQAEIEENNRKAKEAWEKEQKEAEKRNEEAQAALRVEEDEADRTVPESIHSDEGTEHASEPAEMDMRDLDDVPKGNFFAMDQAGPDEQE